MTGTVPLDIHLRHYGGCRAGVTHGNHLDGSVLIRCQSCGAEVLKPTPEVLVAQISAGDRRAGPAGLGKRPDPGPRAPVPDHEPPKLSDSDM